MTDVEPIDRFLGEAQTEIASTVCGGGEGRGAI